MLYLTGVDKFVSRRPIFWERNFTCSPDRARKNMSAQNQSARPIETQLEILLFCSLLSKYQLQLSFFMFPS